MRVGFVGLGHMGLPMARNLLAAGHRLLIQSANADAVASLQAAGAAVAPSVRAIAAEVDVLCACRVTPQHSIDVFIGDAGAISGGAAGLVCIDFSTIDPGTSRLIAERLGAAGIGYLDAPVSGGPDGAASASLSIMVGGAAADVARARPVLDVLGQNVFHMGASGAGVSTKLCNNLITGTVHVLLAEAMVLGTKSGIDPRLLYDVLRTSTARSNTLERALPRHFLPRNFAPGSALTTIIKDLDCALQTARDLGVSLSLPATARDRFAEAAARGHGAKDLTAVILPMEEIAGVTVGPA